MGCEELRPADTLILGDSLRSKFGNLEPFSKKERSLLSSIYPSKNIVFTAAVQCPSLKERDMTPEDITASREYLDKAIDKVKPRLVLACGNLAMKMLIKKSGIMDKRGSSYEFTSSDGHVCTVVPIYHPYAVLKEPRHRYLFETDIKNAYEKYVLGKKAEKKFKYEVISDHDALKNLTSKLANYTEPVAVDIETTGLNFRKDKIMSVAIAAQEQTWVIPVDHKDSPFVDSPSVLECLNRILSNDKNVKVFHNAKFDLKFLINYGVKVKNVWDTKIAHHLINENAPKSLMDLVKLYFADELENL